jgi:uncharacterized membrane protein (UPF0127 family)
LLTFPTKLRDDPGQRMPRELKRMRRIRFTVLFAALIFLLGLQPAALSTRDFLASLDRSALIIETAAGEKHRFDVWLARTREQKARGLMFVESLDAEQGMLFLYDTPQPVSMWMKNTLISLDMLFIESDGRIAGIAQHTEPHSLASIAAPAPVVAVLELAAGTTATLGIATGDYVRHGLFSRLRRAD